MIARELMGHVAVPLRWKESLYHRGCSFNVKSILQAGLNASGREETDDKHYSSHNWILLGAKKKKNSTMIYRGRGKCTFRANRILIRTLSTVSTSPKHKKCSFGRQGLTPLLFTIQCRPTASKKWYPYKTYFSAESFHVSFNSKDSSQRRLGIAAAAAAAARHTIKHRETCCGGKSILKLISEIKGSHKMQCSKTMEE